MTEPAPPTDSGQMPAPRRPKRRLPKTPDDEDLPNKRRVDRWSPALPLYPIERADIFPFHLVFPTMNVLAFASDPFTKYNVMDVRTFAEITPKDTTTVTRRLNLGILEGLEIPNDHRDTVSPYLAPYKCVDSVIIPTHLLYASCCTACLNSRLMQLLPTTAGQKKQMEIFKRTGMNSSMMFLPFLIYNTGTQGTSGAAEFEGPIIRTIGRPYTAELNRRMHEITTPCEIKNRKTD